MSITNTRLYREIAPYLSESDQKEFARMLNMVPNINEDAVTLSGAFTFVSTPQGHNYWATLSYRLWKAGSPFGSSLASERFNGATR